MVTATAVREGKGNNIAKEKYMKENLTELVAVRLFKDNDKYNSDVFVSVNCNNYLIRRGETVMVPLFIKRNWTEQSFRERERNTTVMKAGSSR